MSPPLRYSEVDGLARITLDRPARLNAFDDELAEAWVDATHSATTAPRVGAILLDAMGPSFCAGGDLRVMAGMSDGDELAQLATRINRGILALLESSTPVVVAAHGTTAGGGLGLLLAADYAVVADDSRIGSLYAKVGLTPDLAVSALLADAVGERRALRLVLDDSLIDAGTALEWGLVTEVTAPDLVRSRAEAVAQSWLSGATRAYGEAKRLIRSRGPRTLREQLAEEARTIGAALDGDEARPRVARFGGSS